MAIKLTAESFIAGVRQSGLISNDELDRQLRQFESSGVDTTDSAEISAALVRAEAITNWQAEKLLQGKFKGFLLGRYRLLNLLGKGEMSSIYLAEHTRMKRRCAIKVLPANKVKDTSYLGRFHREAEAVASLDHPNIVRAYDVDMEVEAGTEIHFLVMEYVDGKDLEKLREKTEFSINQAADYLRQAAEGLAHAHEHGLIHRDIKPGNLLLDNKGMVKLLDLGLARFFNQNEEESLTIKHDEKVLGTADYLAPEQAVDSHAVDARADIYSLGCTFYYLLVGQPPFVDGTLVQRLLAHQTKTPVSVLKLRPEVPESLAAILERMMRKKKEDRFQSAREVADALARWLVDNGGTAWCQDHPQLVAKFAGLDALKSPSDAVRKVAKPEPPAATLNTPATSDSGKLAAKAGKRKPTRPGEVPRAAPVVVPGASPSDSGVSRPSGAGSNATPSPVVKGPPLKKKSSGVMEIPPAEQQAPVRIPPTALRPQTGPPKTWAEFLLYNQLWVIVGAVLFAVVLITGVSISLQAKTEAPVLPPDQAPFLVPEQENRN